MPGWRPLHFDDVRSHLEPDADEYARFRDHLQILKSPIARRYSGGKDIQAACGNIASTRQCGTVLPGPEEQKRA